MKLRHCFSLILGAAILLGAQSQAIAFDLKRDYEFSTPLPQTGRVTIRKSIQALPATKLFERCPDNSRLEQFAESTHFLVVVCRDKRNQLKKYWVQREKKTGKTLRLTAQDEPQSQPSGWASGDNQFFLYADGRGRINAYLEVYNLKKQTGWAEALLYHYDKFYDRR